MHNPTSTHLDQLAEADARVKDGLHDLHELLQVQEGLDDQRVHIVPVGSVGSHEVLGMENGLMQLRKAAVNDVHLPSQMGVGVFSVQRSCQLLAVQLVPGCATTCPKKMA